MRLLLIEDSLSLQRSLCTGFRRAGFAIDVVGEGRQGLAFARRGRYDVILLDLTLPGMDGLEVLRQLREAGSDSHVLVLTARFEIEDRVLGLQQGADDYLPKPFAFEELLARVQALVRRRYASKTPAIRIGDLEIDTVEKRVTRGGREVPLSKREFSILEYLARRRGETVSRIEIEDHVYGEKNLPASNAVDSAICTIRKKLARGAPGDADADAQPLIRTRHGLGYVLGESD
jgi:DNA-binding response OmpR family regulator